MIYSMMKYKFSDYMKALTWFLFMLTCYGIVLILNGDKVYLNTGAPGFGFMVANSDYIKTILVSLLPIYPFYVFTHSSSVFSPRLDDIAHQHVAYKILKQHDNFMIDSGNHSSPEGNLLFRLTSPVFLPSRTPRGGTSGSYTLNYTLLIYSAKQPFTRGPSINITGLCQLK
jgi:hypothetical protein